MIQPEFGRNQRRIVCECERSDEPSMVQVLHLSNGDTLNETTETFYTCTICQSYAPTHVCIITPERLGLCGAYNWLDGKAMYEINPAGPNQPIEKGACLDANLGIFEGINEFVYNKSNKTVEQVSLYSMIHSPMTSCGCFECIVAFLPMCNGVMIVNREHKGETPCGMTFSTQSWPAAITTSPISV